MLTDAPDDGVPLVADPTFQLNVVLWMLQPLPVSEYAPRPILHEIGYAVRTLGDELTPDPELQRLVATALGLKGVPRPDVVASAPPGAPWPVIECKASSFSSDSSTAEQARKLLAYATDVSLAAGAPPGHVINGAAVWFTRTEEGEALAATSRALAVELTAAEISPASAGVLGVSMADNGVVVGHVGGDLPPPMSDTLGQPVVVVPRLEDEIDPRPLYLIPFDPGVTQAPEERERCLTILQERGRMEAASRIGQSLAPCTVTLDGRDLLRAATFGMSEKWRDHDDRAKAARLLVEHVLDLLKAMKPRPLLRLRPGGATPTLDIALSDDEQREAFAGAIIAGRPEAVADLPPEQLGLDL